MVDNTQIFVLDMAHPDAPAITLKAILEADQFTDAITVQDTIQMLDDTITALNKQVTDLTSELTATNAQLSVVKSSLTTATTTTTTTKVDNV